MHVTLTTAGSRGDVQPYIALGKALIKHGHDVLLLAPDNFSSLADYHGVPFKPMVANFEDLLQTRAGKRLMNSGTNLVRAATAIRDMIEPIVEQFPQDMMEATADTDIVVTQAGVAMFAQTIAEKRNLPIINSAPVPLTPTRAHPSPMWFSDQSFGGWYNHLTGKFLERTMWWLVRPYVNQVREENDLDAYNAGAIFKALDQLPTMGAISPSFYPRPKDYADNIIMTGYWFLDDPDYVPPTELVDFLDVGDKPIYIGFGSMSGDDPHAVAQVVLDALEKSGQRGLLLTGWGGMAAEDVPDDVFVVNDVPFDWLFPRMSAVIHHGGAGTTASALRAGVPQLVLPFIADQPFWGRQVAEQGLGVPPIPRKELTRNELTHAIRTLTYDMPMRQRAHEMGEKIRAEDGTGKAIAYIEEILANYS